MTGAEGVEGVGAVGAVAVSGAMGVVSGDAVLGEEHPVRKIPTSSIETSVRNRLLNVCLDIIEPPSS